MKLEALFENIFILRQPRPANFVYIVKLKATFNGQIKFKRIRKKMY